jgi:pyruvate kinase
LQKRMIKMARKMHKLTITATQMMESMIESPVPTRAEVSDCANAVLDGTDAVMLSAESAAGKYPLEAVQAMARTCLEAERSGESKVEAEFDKVTEFAKIDEAVAMSALYAASKLPIKAIVCISHSGASALWLSRYNTGVPIYVFTQELNTYRKLALFRHVRPIMIDPKVGSDREEQLAFAQLELLRAGVVVPGDKLVVTLGVHKAAVGSGANTMRIVQVGSASR